ncbi:DUF2703 domain-containing protein [Caldicoprobacter algeriensis]|uniref:DUF2703 domain-containing protein n=1 Tax=Caldicoprobacter algeriensis TaxID=699281 RepID=UPI0020792FAB|nr:DUF2703 domain-containing protein [Caldicoprobacter algeriensis]MCM8900647.1 DUF2703 domain-containing protein [Caldicoprobacter algeriensis]
MKCCDSQKNNSCCSTVCECGEQNGSAQKKKIVIDFMYLDLSVCDRCKGTEESLEEAISDVARVLELTGAEVIVNKIHIDSEEKAIQYKFKSSPTIRINGKDIQLEVKESLCESCGDLCGDEVDCRVWVYNGKEYNVPPKAMIVDAILREVYGSSTSDIDENKEEQKYQLPENLKRFFQAMREKGEK